MGDWLPLNTHIDNVYVLWIDERKKESMEYKCDKIGLNVQMYEGIDGKNDIYCQDKGNDNALTYGQCGHLCSFMSILSDAVINQYGSICILESDVYFGKGNDISHRLESFLKMNWDICYLGASQGSFYSEKTWKHILDKCDINVEMYYEAYKTLGTFGICIKRNMFIPLYLLCLEMKQPTDVCCVMLQEESKYKCIVANPNMIACNVSSSSTSKNKHKYSQRLKMATHRWNQYNYDFIDIYKCINKGSNVVHMQSYHALKHNYIKCYDKNHNEISCVVKWFGNRVSIYFTNITHISYILTYGVFT